MTGAAVLTVGLALLGATGWLTASAVRLDSVVARLLAVYVVAYAWLIVSCLVLSAFDGLSRWPLLALLAGGAVVAGLVRRRAGATAPLLAGARASARDVLADPLVAVLVAIVAAELLYVLVFALVIPQSDWDALIYHLPRAAAWVQAGAVGWIPGVDDPRVNGFAPHAEIGIAATMALARSDRYAGLVQVFSLLATCLAIVLLARRLGLSRRSALFGAALFATFPVVAVQAPTALNDLALAAPLAVATAFAVGRGRSELALAGVATALGFGVKLTALLVAPVVALVVVAMLPARRALAALVACVVGALVGSYWYVVARHQTGSFDGGVAAWQQQVPDRSPGDVFDRVRSFGVSFFDLSGMVPRDRVLFPLLAVGILAVAALRAWRGERARGLVLTGLVVLLAPPLVYAARALLRPSERGGEPSLSIVDPVTSWYGAAFVVAWLGTGVAIARGIRRGTVRPAAMAVLAAPIVFLPIFALATVDDGIRGRFFILPVALACATFGLVMTWRWLAWGVVALAGLLVVLSFTHLDNRPAGIRLLAARTQPALWTAPRWQALAAHVRQGTDDPAVIRALQQLVPDDVVLAAAIGRNQYLYPLYDSALRRRVVYVGRGLTTPATASWLVVGPGGEVRICPGDWATVSEPGTGWRILHRTPSRVRQDAAPCPR